VLNDGATKLGMLVETNEQGDVLLAESPKQFERYHKARIASSTEVSPEDAKAAMEKMGLVGSASAEGRRSDAVEIKRVDADDETDQPPIPTTASAPTRARQHDEAGATGKDRQAARRGATGFAEGVQFDRSGPAFPGQDGDVGGSAHQLSPRFGQGLRQLRAEDSVLPRSRRLRSTQGQTQTRAVDKQGDRGDRRGRGLSQHRSDHEGLPDRGTCRGAGWAKGGVAG